MATAVAARFAAALADHLLVRGDPRGDKQPLQPLQPLLVGEEKGARGFLSEAWNTFAFLTEGKRFPPAKMKPLRGALSRQRLLEDERW